MAWINDYLTSANFSSTYLGWNREFFDNKIPKRTKNRYRKLVKLAREDYSSVRDILRANDLWFSGTSIINKDGQVVYRNFLRSNYPADADLESLIVLIKLGIAPK